MFASRFTGDSCVAILERAFGRLRESGIAELVRHVGFLEALDDYDIVLTEPPGRTGSRGAGPEPCTRRARLEGRLLTVLGWLGPTGCFWMGDSG